MLAKLGFNIFEGIVSKYNTDSIKLLKNISEHHLKLKETNQIEAFLTAPWKTKAVCKIDYTPLSNENHDSEDELMKDEH